VSEIAQMKADVEAAHAAWLAAKAAYDAALVAAFPFRVGDIIRSTDGRLARVYAIYVSSAGPRWAAALQKKDGTFGKLDASHWRNEWRAATLHERPAVKEHSA
jgi:hypothetical protein